MKRIIKFNAPLILYITIPNIFLHGYSWRSIWDKGFKISKNKSGEIGLSIWNEELLGFSINFQPIGIDHGGLKLDIVLFSIGFNFYIYDNRHWDISEGKWVENKIIIPESKLRYY